MHFVLNFNSSVPVFIQIENQIREAIESGEVKSDDQLPSVRELSEQIEINPNAIAKAYRDLEVLGLVYTKQEMGVYVR